MVDGLEKITTQPPQMLLVSILHRVPCLIYSSLTHTAPSAAPSNVSVSPVNRTTITVQWGPVNCIDRNGNVTGYSVQYGVQGNGNRNNKSVLGDSSGGMTTISGLSPATMYTVVVAAENSAGTGDYSDPLTVETPGSEYIYSIFFTLIQRYCISDVSLSVNGDIIPNHGYVMISAISSTDDTALLCRTNKPASGSNSGGDWFAPDGTRVDGTDVPGFIRNRDPMVVRLLRNTDTGTPAEGIYHCVIEDTTVTIQTVYVGLYNSGGGVVHYHEPSSSL